MVELAKLAMLVRLGKLRRSLENDGTAEQWERLARVYEKIGAMTNAASCRERAEYLSGVKWR